ncbi:hypothetical protein D3C86_1238220 [compost metagenome]
MKKGFVALLLLGGLVSCSKEYTCTCDYYTDGILQNSDNVKISEDNKNWAADKCTAMSDEYTTNVNGTPTHYKTECAL